MNRLNQIKIFDFEGVSVRTLNVNATPYFVGKDVAEALGYKKSRNAVQVHVESEDKKDALIQGTLGGKQNMTIITESGVYSLIMSSRLPTAKRFKHWITSDVLPSIRKHGAYMTDETIEQVLTDPDTIIKLATQLKDERAERVAAEHRVKALKPKADYTDRMLSNPGLETTSMIAKNYGYSTVKFNRMLYALGVQYRQGGVWMLYAKYQDEGYTQIEPYEFINHVDKRQVANTMKWTQKGAKFLYDFLKVHGILPKVEQLELEGME